MSILEVAIACHNMNNACALVQGALGITDGGVAAYSMPRDECWPKMGLHQRRSAIAEWLRNELLFGIES